MTTTTTARTTDDGEDDGRSEDLAWVGQVMKKAVRARLIAAGIATLPAAARRSVLGRSRCNSARACARTRFRCWRRLMGCGVRGSAPLHQSR